MICLRRNTICDEHYNIIITTCDMFIKVLCSMWQVQFVSTFTLAGNALSGLAQHLIDVKV